MGRPRTFDEEAILDRAMLLFWRKGYEATSMNDLVEELELGRGSIYAAFGDKHRLFIQALGRYLGRQADLLASALDDQQPALPQLRRLFETLLHSESACSGAGCFSVNSIAELLPGNLGVAELARASLRSAEDAFTAQLERARAAGELTAAVSPREAARLLVALIQGLQILRKADPDPARLAASLDAAFALITSPQPAAAPASVPAAVPTA
ncbi:TetR/AcrR family transcriptional repressor of nem operon [Kitasatospora sp. MAP12-15]|uniref:TetR/AcrR family transcriptional regulator n=1 Tax=unclassified Kitasatospora TaxID=2633591 RepID=UPI0024745E51|nr:TetR/AcrR family transcriptional regulator [Kitasatospora sp. MAP12-44]MDH6115144.1 TetR/AcrR family transcriptional repressor of nem operon [Kitasatospora sp. MAP12-44]